METITIRIGDKTHYYVMTSRDEMIDITDTALMSDFAISQVVPKIDSLLDWRLRLSELLKHEHIDKQPLIKNELNAVDFLLNKFYR